jgi:hypothetical protein
MPTRSAVLAVAFTGPPAGHRADRRAVIIPAARDQGTIREAAETILAVDGTINASTVLQHPGQQLDRHRSANVGQPAITRPTGPAPAAATFAARLAVVPCHQRSPRQPARPTWCPVGQQHQRGHDLDAIHRQGSACACHPVSPCPATKSRMWL